jgi:hypothetical protein
MRQIGHLPELYEDARSEIYKILRALEVYTDLNIRSDLFPFIFP